MASMKGTHSIRIKSSEVLIRGGLLVVLLLLLRVMCYLDTVLPSKILFWLVTLAFTGSIGMTFVILACALPEEKVWWPMIVVLFYILAPLPTLIARRQQVQFSTAQQSCMDFAIFITMGLVVSSFALPIILSRASKPPVIENSACYLTLAGNLVIYFTYIGFFLTLFQDEYGIWNNAI